MVVDVMERQTGAAVSDPHWLNRIHRKISMRIRINTLSKENASFKDLCSISILPPLNKLFNQCYVPQIECGSETLVTEEADGTIKIWEI